MCGSDAPEDKSAEVAAIEAQTAREAAQQEQQRKAQERAEFDARLSSAFGSGVGDAESYFQSQGLDPKQYAPAIQRKANLVRGSVPIGDAAPGSYFANLGQQVYESEQEGYRGQKMRGLDEVAPTGFATKRIDNTADDALIEAILSEQMGAGDTYIRNLLDRGVITSGGYDAAKKNLDQQSPGARLRLNETGSGLIEGGRSGAENIANTARGRASNLRLGQQFDPYQTGSELGRFFTDFFSNLGTKFRATAPTNLFDTAGLAGIAGASQGAGNTQFNPMALAGVQPSPDDEEEELFGSPF